MGLIRVGALVASLMLLAATLVALVDHRSDLLGEQDARVLSAATAATNSVQNTVLRARAVVEVSNADTSPEELLATFDASAEACVGTRCSGPDLAALSTFDSAASKSLPSIAVVDRMSNSILVVARTPTATASIQLPLDAVVGALASQWIAELDVDVNVDVDSSDPGQPQDVSGVANESSESVVIAQISESFDGGSLLVRARVESNVGWGADTPGPYVVVLGLGTILVVLAGWTFLAERRNLERRATTDELTGLANRREFERLSEEAIEMAGRFGTGLCIMLIDLNGFKQINDTRGHQFGDRVLKACAERLVDALRDTDLVARWGGDEFVVILPGLVEANAVRNSAERIAASMSSAPMAGDVSVSGSIGAALYPRHGSTFHELMQAADVAMYEAKTTGVVHRLAATVEADMELLIDRRKPVSL
ncbi:MAG: diguanylate cyclase (GGDEF)-like protein [Ilumatobacter sp.]|jgi:diguanylate cyclase (GGDEF)-like protein